MSLIRSGPICFSRNSSFSIKLLFVLSSFSFSASYFLIRSKNVSAACPVSSRTTDFKVSSSSSQVFKTFSIVLPSSLTRLSTLNFSFLFCAGDCCFTPVSNSVMPSSSYWTLVSFLEIFFSPSVAVAPPFPIFISFCERAGPTVLLRISFSSFSSFIVLLWS